MTSNLVRRADEHKNKLVGGYTAKYNLSILVYYEMSQDVLSVISREKQIKQYSRQKKIDLIKAMNPEFEDLFPKICNWPFQDSDFSLRSKWHKLLG